MPLCKNQFPNIIRNLTYSENFLVRAFDNQPEQIVQGLHPALVSEELNKRRIFVDEQYMDGLIMASEYQDLKNNINSRLFEEKRKLQESMEVLSPFKEYLVKQVPMLEDLVGFYKSVDGNTKRKILGCIFSEKLHLEEKKVATPKFTTPIELLLNASKVLQSCKNKKEVNKDLFFQFAPPIGESCKFDAMIDYSIILKSTT